MAFPVRTVSALFLYRLCRCRRIQGLSYQFHLFHNFRFFVAERSFGSSDPRCSPPFGAGRPNAFHRTAGGLHYAVYGLSLCNCRQFFEEGKRKITFCSSTSNFGLGKSSCGSYSGSFDPTVLPGWMCCGALREALRLSKLL